MSYKLKIFLGLFVLAAVALVGRFGLLIYKNLNLKANIGSAASSYSAASQVDPLNVDSDHDGLSDRDEIIYGTDPHNPDTDGDGYLDGEEVATGHDPLDPADNDKSGPGLLNTAEQGSPNLTNRFVNYTVAGMLGTDGQLDPTQLTDAQKSTIMATIVGDTQIALTASPVTDNDITLSTDSPDDIRRYMQPLQDIINNSFLHNSDLSNITGITSTGNQTSDSYYKTYATLKALPVPPSWKEIHKQLMSIALQLGLDFRALTPQAMDDDPVKASLALQTAQNTFLEFSDLFTKIGQLIASQHLAGSK